MKVDAVNTPHMMELKSKILNLLLILTSLIGFLEWGKDSKMFLYQAEAEIISKLFTDPVSVLHPFTILPLAGQIVLFITLFQHKPNKTLTFISIGGIGLLLVLMFVIGILSLNFKILLSTIPFLVTAFFTVHYHRKINNTAQ
jgi:hypothetical protein